MLKRENWRTLQESLSKASQPKPPLTAEDRARFFARLAEELSLEAAKHPKQEHGDDGA